ncbi:MAG: N-acetyltransferase [Cyanobacteria bacterium]|jgi:GNAT superfamily N-acetyltransferase|nr:N-acetyltransferase [Cyanobacteriota bacterium]
MPASSVLEELLLDPKRHDRSAFACGESALDAFLQRHAHQNMRKGISQTWVLVSPDKPSTIAGYYCLAPAEVVLANLQPADARPLPPYPIPCFRMGRLARDLRWRGEGMGALLIGLAVERCLRARQSVGGYALIVDAKGEKAKNFYLRYGFRPYIDTPNSLYLPFGGGLG